ncbi:MAG: DUF4923 family protein [Muribaculaceae bacterium]|nr:DUF4923 family protein [Muribaculaceae bacterium]
MKMRFLLLMAIAMMVFANAAAQDEPIVMPDTLAQDDMLLPEEREALIAVEVNKAVAGIWQYDKPSVQAQGSSVLGKLGKPIAKSKLKKKLDKAFKKLKIKKRFSSLELTPEGIWTMNVAGVKMSGKYTYEPESERLTLKWHGVPMSSMVHRDGKHLHMLFDTDQLLNVLRIISGFSSNETLKAIALLSKNYYDVRVGFDLKPKK